MTTRNSARTIEDVLTSALSQSMPSEVVVVDNYSSDDTASIVKRLGCRLVVAGGERSRQRNVGAREAIGEWLLFVDADMVMDPKLVASCVEACETRDADAVYIPQDATGEGFFARCRKFEKSLYESDYALEAPRFVRRGVFADVGGYDEQLVAAEDWDFAARLRARGTVLARSSNKLTHLDGRISLSKTFAKMRYYAPSLLRYRATRPEDARAQFSPLRAAWLRSWRRIIRNPHLFAGMTLLKVVEVMGYMAGVIDVQRARASR